MSRRALLSFCFALCGTVAMAAAGETVGYAAAHTAKISLADARKIALARIPGTIVHTKVKEKKNDHIVYNIKVKPRDAAARADTVKKVEIDGDTGQILKIKDVKAKAKDD